MNVKREKVLFFQREGKEFSKTNKFLCVKSITSRKLGNYFRSTEIYQYIKQSIFQVRFEICFRYLLLFFFCCCLELFSKSTWNMSIRNLFDDICQGDKFEYFFYCQKYTEYSDRIFFQEFPLSHSSYVKYCYNTCFLSETRSISCLQLFCEIFQQRQVMNFRAKEKKIAFKRGETRAIEKWVNHNLKSNKLL